MATDPRPAQRWRIDRYRKIESIGLIFHSCLSGTRASERARERESSLLREAHDTLGTSAPDMTLLCIPQYLTVITNATTNPGEKCPRYPSCCRAVPCHAMPCQIALLRENARQKTARCRNCCTTRVRSRCLICRQQQQRMHRLLPYRRQDVKAAQNGFRKRVYLLSSTNLSQASIPPSHTCRRHLLCAALLFPLSLPSPHLISSIHKKSRDRSAWPSYLHNGPCKTN